MAENSAISWTDHTFNPWLGCEKVSPACDHCYAESWAKRAGWSELWEGERRRTSAAIWAKPLQWNKNARDAYASEFWTGQRVRVFCPSLADGFDDQVPEQWRADLWRLIRSTTALDWQLLTKRPENIAKMLPADWGDGWDHVWLGTTCENQAMADLRIPPLLLVPAKVRFLSCEPLLERLDLEYPQSFFPDGLTHCCSGHECGCMGLPMELPIVAHLDWVICGGESGGHYRSMDPVWARSLRDQCAAAGTPFHMKQMGGLRASSMPPIPDDLLIRDFPRTPFTRRRFVAACRAVIPAASELHGGTLLQPPLIPGVGTVPVPPVAPSRTKPAAVSIPTPSDHSTIRDRHQLDLLAPPERER